MNSICMKYQLMSLFSVCVIAIVTKWNIVWFTDEEM